MFKQLNLHNDVLGERNEPRCNESFIVTYM